MSCVLHVRDVTLAPKLKGKGCIFLYFPMTLESVGFGEGNLVGVSGLTKRSISVRILYDTE